MAGYAPTALFAYLFVDLTIVALPVASVAVVARLLWQAMTGRRHCLSPSPIHLGVLTAFVLAHIAAASLSIAPLRAVEQMTTLAVALAAYLIAIQLAAALPRGVLLGAP